MAFDAYIRKAVEQGKPIFARRFKLFGEHDGTDVENPKYSLQALRQELGPHFFSCQYLNDPTDDSLLEFKRSFFKEYDQSQETTKRINQGYKILSIDPAIRLKETTDDNGIVLTSTDDDGFVYIIDAYAYKANLDGLLNEISKLIDVYKPDLVLIESLGFQLLIADAIRKKMQKENKMVRLEEYNPGTREIKAARIRKLIPQYANGRIFHRSGLVDLVDQLIQFPRGAHDDIIDSLASQIQYWKPRNGKVENHKLEKGSKAWWDAIRKYNIKETGGVEKLFKDLSNKTIYRNRGR